MTMLSRVPVYLRSARDQPLGLEQPCQSFSFPRISLDSTDYAPIGGWDFKEINTVPIGRNIAGNEAIKLGISRIPMDKNSCSLL